MKWVLWGLLLVLTNGASTLTSRARNTPSFGYHAIAACINHGVWMITNVMFIGVAIDIAKSPSLTYGIQAFLFYTSCSTVGSVTVHWLSIKYLEKGNRRVGAYEAP